MIRISKSRIKKIGLPPGTPVHVGDHHDDAIEQTFIAYNESGCREERIESINEFRRRSGDRQDNLWVNVTGLHNLAVIEEIGKEFSIHPLTLEDIVNTEHRPKIEEHENYIFTVMKIIDYSEESEELYIEQVSLVLGADFLITFIEKKSPIFEPVKERLVTGKGKLRSAGPDYLYYSILDAIIDNYFLALEAIDEVIGDIENELIQEPKNETIHTIHRMKRELIFLRKSVFPLREIIAYLYRLESILISSDLKPFLRDVQDHAIQIIDTAESYRDMITGMLDIYLSTVNNRINDVMRVLTVISTIFIPLTFIAGVYGMNFKYMPELEVPQAYPVLIGIMAFLGIGMALVFKKKKWW